MPRKLENATGLSLSFSSGIYCFQFKLGFSIGRGQTEMYVGVPIYYWYFVCILQVLTIIWRESMMNVYCYTKLTLVFLYVLGVSASTF